MTPAVLDRPAGLFDAAPGGEPAARGRVTLEELLTAALDEARTNGSTECPVCHARMTSARASAAGGAGGAEYASAGCADCSGCGSRLS